MDQLYTKSLGRIQAGGHNFALYELTFSLRPVATGGTYHGGSLLLVLRDGRYWGRLNGFDELKPKVTGAALVLTAEGPTKGGRRSWAIRFTAAGPPRRTLADGQFVDFER